MSLCGIHYSQALTLRYQPDPPHAHYYRRSRYHHHIQHIRIQRAHAPLKRPTQTLFVLSPPSLDLVHIMNSKHICGEQPSLVQNHPDVARKQGACRITPDCGLVRIGIAESRQNVVAQ